MTDLSRLAYVDLETTGARPTRDRITEIGILLVDDGVVTEQWSSLVNPGLAIPTQIQHLTGINNEMVRDAPGFPALAEELLSLLEDRVFVAHNVRFDYGFLRNEFQRLGCDIRYPVLCTVKLSRQLEPQHKRHNLDSLITRHHLHMQSRHRALDDARVLPELVNSLARTHGWPALESAMMKQLRRSSLPPHLDEDRIDQIPRTPGVYLFYGEEEVLLYVGKGVDLRSRILSHFSDDHRNDREQRIAQQVRHIDWIETAGELGALFREAALIKQRQPIHNRQLRASRSLFSIGWNSESTRPPQVIDHDQADLLQRDNLFGLFKSRRQALKTLRQLVEDHQLCHKLTGLEQGKGACFARQLHKCRGACVGEESELQHRLRLMEALTPLKIKGWPYTGAIGILEHNPDSGLSEIHLLEQWRHLGSVTDEAALNEFAAETNPMPMDRDIYRILLRFLSKAPEVIELPASFSKASEQSPAEPLQYQLDL
jgi:DNA polymerase-3 subunit epsilon